jgi:sugar diacid utilization regulator
MITETRKSFVNHLIAPHSTWPQFFCQRVAFGYDLSAQRQELLVKKETALRCVQAIRKSEFEIYVRFI